MISSDRFAADYRLSNDLTGWLTSLGIGGRLASELVADLPRNTHIRLLCFDGDGFVLITKRLERGTSAFSANDANRRELGRDELVLMLEGIDRIDTRRRLRYSRK